MIQGRMSATVSVTASMDVGFHIGSILRALLKLMSVWLTRDVDSGSYA